MSTIEKNLQIILGGTSYGFTIEIDDHKKYYDDVEKYLERFNEDKGLTPELIAGMVEHDKIIHLQFYPDSPGGFYQIWGWDLKTVLEQGASVFTDA